MDPIHAYCPQGALCHISEVTASLGCCAPLQECIKITDNVILIGGEKLHGRFCCTDIALFTVTREKILHQPLA